MLQTVKFSLFNRKLATQMHSRKLKLVKNSLAFGLILLSLAPIVNIFRIIITTGANNLSSDYVVFINFFQKIISGNYNWTNYFADTFYQPHSLALPVLVQLAVIYLTHWNTYVSLIIGLVLMFLRLPLLFNALTCQQKQTSFSRYFLWFLLAALVFSTSQIDVFGYEQIGLAYSINLFGFSLGIWGLVCFRERWSGVIIMTVGGIIATLSTASGLLAWPAFFIGLILLNYQKIWHYLIWFGAAVLAALPYLFFAVLYRREGNLPGGQKFTNMDLVSNLKFQNLISAIGWPFVNNTGTQWNPNQIPAAFLIGLIGLFLVISGFGLLIARWNSSVRVQATPALMLITFSLLSVLQIGLFRESIAPWYIPVYMHFWIGLGSLAQVLWVNRRGETVKIVSRFGKANSYSIPFWCTLLGMVLAASYVTSNLNYDDKMYLMGMRNPAAEACLRNYRFSTPDCEFLLFRSVGNTGNIRKLAKPLEEYHLGVFAPDQEWSLQGDYVLDNVENNPGSIAKPLFWSPDLTDTRASYSSVRHLNLFMPAPNSISWTLSLPENVVEANFISAVAISKSVPKNANSSGVNVAVYITPENEPEVTVYQQRLRSDQQDWQSFNFRLNQYAGKTITLKIVSATVTDESSNYGWAMYRYPHIAVKLDTTRPATHSGTVVRVLSTPATKDLQFEIKNSALWAAYRMEPVPVKADEPASWLVGEIPAIQYLKPINACLNDYSTLYLRTSTLLAPSRNQYQRLTQTVVDKFFDIISPNRTKTPHGMRIYYLLAGQASFDETHVIKIPVIMDGELHDYVYPLRLLNLNPETRLQGIRVDPVFDIDSNGKDQALVKIADFRLTSSNNGSTNSCKN